MSLATGIGGIGYPTGRIPRSGTPAEPTPGTPAGGGYINSLPAVSDPEEAFSQITRGEYNHFRQNYGQFERDLISRAQNDTSLIDDARENSALAAGVQEGIAARNASRYGSSLTQAQIKEQARGFDRSATLGATQSLNDAKLAQHDLNQGMLAGLIDIGQGVNRTAQAGLGDAAANASALDQSYRNARTASRNQTVNTVAGLGSAAILALAL